MEGPHFALTRRPKTQPAARPFLYPDPRSQRATFSILPRSCRDHCKVRSQLILLTALISFLYTDTPTFSKVTEFSCASSTLKETSRFFSTVSIASTSLYSRSRMPILSTRTRSVRPVSFHMMSRSVCWLFTLLQEYVHHCDGFSRFETNFS
jgi:hypothetical protein